MSYTAREFSHVAKKWLLLLLQKYRGKTLHQSLWGEIRGIRSCRSHSELRKHQIVEEEDICVVSTKNLSIVLLARWHSHCILNNGMYAEKYTHRKRQRFHLHLLLQQANDHFSSFFVCKSKILVSRTLSTGHFYCLRFCIRNKTGTHVFWENGVDYPRVSPAGRSPAGQKARGLWVRDWPPAILVFAESHYHGIAIRWKAVNLITV